MSIFYLTIAKCFLNLYYILMISLLNQQKEDESKKNINLKIKIDKK